MTSPRVTIILSSLNHDRFVAGAIQNVLDQTFTDFEFYIIDDCSEDGSWSVIRSFSDPRIIAIQNPVRSRAAYGFNETIRYRAKGEFIAIHHSDDAWLPTKLEKQVAFLDANPEVGAVFTRVNVIDEGGGLFTDSNHFYYSAFNQANRSRIEWLRYFFFEGNCLCHPSVLARRQALLDAGLYDRRLGQITDFDLWVRLCLRHEIHILEEVLTLFRILNKEANQSGEREENFVRGRNEWLLVLGRYLQLGNEDDFFAVFREMLPKSHAAGNCLPFLLALAATQAGDGFRVAFGMRLLYDLFAEESIVREINEKYNFDYQDLIALSAQVDAFQGKKLWEQWLHIRALKNEVERIKSTVSWRITAPLRATWNFYLKCMGRKR